MAQQSIKGYQGKGWLVSADSVSAKVGDRAVYTRTRGTSKGAAGTPITGTLHALPATAFVFVPDAEPTKRERLEQALRAKGMSEQEIASLLG